MDTFWKVMLLKKKAVRGKCSLAALSAKAEENHGMETMHKAHVSDMGVGVLAATCAHFRFPHTCPGQKIGS